MSPWLGPAATKEGRAFQRAIAESSDDDAPRLIYCDWLEENGYGDCAAFVREHITLARLGEPTLLPWSRTEAGRAYARVFGRCGDWLRANFRNWVYPLADVLGGVCTTSCFSRWGNDFSRGFLHHVRMPSAPFVEHARVLFGLQPVTSAELTAGNAWGKPLCVGRGYPRALYDAGRTGAGGVTLRVPGPVFRFLARIGIPCTVRGAVARFPRPVHGSRVVSLAAVAFGREEAGLPPLPPVADLDSLFRR